MASAPSRVVLRPCKLPSPLLLFAVLFGFILCPVVSVVCCKVYRTVSVQLNKRCFLMHLGAAFLAKLYTAAKVNPVGCSRAFLTPFHKNIQVKFSRWFSRDVTWP